jgi:hypothetical protein
MSLRELPINLYPRLSEYLPVSDIQRLRSTSHRLHESVIEMTRADYNNELDAKLDDLLDTFKNDCSKIIDWMNSTSKGDLILMIASTRRDQVVDIVKKTGAPTYIAEILYSFYIYSEQLATSKEIISYLRDYISIVLQLSTWKDIQNIEANHGPAIRLFYDRGYNAPFHRDYRSVIVFCFFRNYIRGSDLPIIRRWLTTFTMGTDEHTKHIHSNMFDYLKIGKLVSMINSKDELMILETNLFTAGDKSYLSDAIFIRRIEL